MTGPRGDAVTVYEARLRAFNEWAAEESRRSATAELIVLMGRHLPHLPPETTKKGGPKK